MLLQYPVGCMYLLKLRFSPDTRPGVELQNQDTNELINKIEWGSHRHRKQTYGYQREKAGGWGDGLNRRWGLTYTCFPSGSDSTESACNCRRPGFDPWAGKIPWRRAWQPTLIFSPGESHGQRSLVGYSPWVRRESDTTERSVAHQAPSVHGYSPGKNTGVGCHLCKINSKDLPHSTCNYAQ